MPHSAKSTEGPIDRVSDESHGTGQQQRRDGDEDR